MTATKGETASTPAARPAPKPRPNPAKHEDEDVVELDDELAAGTDDTPDEPDDPAERAGGGMSRRMVTIAVVALLFAGVLTVAVLKWIEAGRQADEQAAREAVATRAGEFGIALLSYEHGALDQAKDRVLSLATGSFAETYSAAFSAGLKQTIDKVKADASADVKDVFVADVGDTMANAIVMLDSQVKSAAGTREVSGLYLQVELVSENGEWKVSNVKSVAGGAGAAPTPDQGGSKGGGK